MWEMAAAMAAAGLLQGMRQQQMANRDRELQAATATYSPWTNLTPQRPMQADVLGPAMQGAIQGYAMQQQANTLESQQNAAQQALKTARAEAEMYNAATTRMQEGMPLENSLIGKSLNKWGTNPALGSFTPPAGQLNVPQSNWLQISGTPTDRYTLPASLSPWLNRY